MIEVSIAAEPIAHIGSFTVTNSMLGTLAVTLFLLIVTFVLHRQMKKGGKLRGLQNIAEVMVEGAFSLMDSVTGNRAHSKKFFALCMTFFLFILFANWFGLLPGVGPIGVHETIHGKEVLVPLFRAASSDLNTTLALGAISLISFQIFGIAAIGFFKYGQKFINVKSPIGFFLGILESVSEVAKLISLAFRLFGNIFAGEVLLLVIAVLVPLIAPLPFFFLEIFVGFIQALVFSMLSLVFLRVATESAH